jgi:biopolymer transport protein ExbD
MSEATAGPDQGTHEEQIAHHKSRRRRSKGGAAAIALNITPMIDVIFQLLIYFIITASFAQDEGILTAKLPEGTGKAPVKPKTPERPIKIRLSSLSVATECRIELIGIGRNPRDFRELAQQLASIQYNSRNPGGSFKADNPVIIEPDGFVRWQHVVNAFNAAIKARYTNVAFSQAREQ